MTRVALRRLWFQVHKWIGLALMILLIPLGLTGSILLAHDWLGEAPQAHATSPSLPLPPSRYVAAAKRALPDGARILQLGFPDRPGEPVTVRAVLDKGGPTTVTLDAESAAAKPPRAADMFLAFAHRFHGSLMIPGVGRTLVGWLGVAMLISSLSGLWLWWPVGRWLRGLRWGRTDALDANLHHLVGFWIALPLAALSLTGAWIAFPAFFSALVGEPAPRRPGGFAGGGGRSVAATHLSLDEAAARLGTRGALRNVSLPGGDPLRWSATLAGGKRLALDDATGALVPAPRPPQGPVMRLMRGLHEGDGAYGPVWRLIVFLGGLAPALLGVTGITMWLRTRRWRAEVMRRRAVRQPAG